MRCQSCNTPVPSNFKFAFTSNRCPSCGKAIMSNEIKALWHQFDEILSKENNDMGDVAVWLMTNFKLTKLSELPPEPAISVEEKPTEIMETPQLAKKSKPAPLATSSDGQPLLDPERVKLFSKRSGVDKIKYETIVNSIKGSPDNSEVDIGDGTLSGGSLGAAEGFLTEEGPPLSSYELEMAKEIVAQASPVGGSMGNTMMDISELKRIQRLEQMETNGSVGKIRRSS